MSDPLEEVRAVFAAAEDVDMAGVPVAGDDAADPEDGPDLRDGEEEGWVGPPPDGPDGPGNVADDRPPEARCVRYPLNDRGNAQRLVEWFGSDLMHVPRVGWFVWTGKVWQADPDGIAVLLKAQQLPELILREIEHVRLSAREMERIAGAEVLRAERAGIEAVAKADRSDDQAARLVEIDRELTAVAGIEVRLGKRKGEWRSFARSSGNAGKIKSAAELAEARLTRPLSELDADPLTINTESGLLHLWTEEAGGRQLAELALAPHCRLLPLTKMVPVAWDEAAECPRFLQFLERVQPDAEMRDFLQRWFGLSMTALTGEQKLVFLYGGGANGKSVLVDLMARMVGDYSATAKIDSLTGKNRRSGGDATPELVPLIGARMVRASEPEEGERLQEGRIKELTGGEPILVRALNKDFVEVRPFFKLTISGNHKPEIRGNDDGIWRRVLLVPFNVQIPKDERDAGLLEKLWAEREGILQWLLDGLRAYLQGGLREPRSVLEATAEYRQDSDPMGSFLTGACVVTGAAVDRVLSAELTAAYNFWLRENGLSEWKASTIQRQLSEKARHWKHPQSGLTITKGKSSLSVYEGLHLEPEFRRRFDQAKAARDGASGGAGGGRGEPDQGAF